ncbi:hypothetical protein ACIQ9P_04250 [Kitasatospora sp. NPDC094019]|uniref:hypothetical protein n=1 Tax=Kitasatospora sp. NPDC094019 TaxID=3364091 RepID=UPI00380AB8B7
MALPSSTSDPPWSLSYKLRFLQARLTGKEDPPLSTRDLADRSSGEDGKPLIAHTVIHATLTGAKTNPPLTTVLGLSASFGCPPAFLLPGYDDLASLEVYDQYEQAREALRLVAELGEAGAEGLLQAAQGMRAARGLDPTEGSLTPARDTATPRRRRLSRSEAAKASRQEIHGLFS